MIHKEFGESLDVTARHWAWAVDGRNALQLAVSLIMQLVSRAQLCGW